MKRNFHRIWNAMGKALLKRGLEVDALMIGRLHVVVGYLLVIIGHIFLLGLFQDDVIKWKHFPRYWAFVRGIHRSPVNSIHKGQGRGAWMFSVICAWTNGKQLSKQLRCRWFKTPLRSLCRQCNACYCWLPIMLQYITRLIDIIIIFAKWYDKWSYGMSIAPFGSNVKALCHSWVLMVE